MAHSKWNLTLVGGFVLAAIISLVVTLALLAGKTGATDRYYTVYANVAGLKFGSPVVFEGYPVGQVEAIIPQQEPDRTVFRVELSITRGWRIPDDSIARPVSPGVLAPQTISIAAGNSNASLKPGDMIQPAGGVDILSSISSAAGNFDELTDTGLLPLLENLNRQVTLFGRILENNVEPMTRDMQIIVGATAEHWPSIAAQTNRATASLAAAGERIDLFMSPARIGAVDRMIGNVDRTAGSLRSAAEELDTVMKAGSDDLLVGLQDFRYSMESLARYTDPVGQSVEAGARNFQDFSRQLRQNPSLLLRPPARDESEAPMPVLESRR
ncbi:MAG: MlaD family protein [Panacagrimonas sp.]